MKGATLIGLAGAAIGLAACAVGPNYQPPVAPVASAYRDRNEAPHLGHAGAWWRGFEDAGLNDLEIRALSRNLDIAQAVAKVTEARAAAGAAKAAELPAGQADAQAAQQRFSLVGTNAANAQFPSFRRVASLYDVTAGASWELDFFGGLRRQSEAATAERQAADAGLGAARLMVSAEVADAYIQLRAYQRRRQLTDQQVVAAAQLLELVRLRFDAGQAARRDVDAAEAAWAQARANLPLLQAGIEAQLNRLAVLSGQTPESARGDLEQAADVPLGRPIPVGRPADLLRARPDLVAAERRLAAANARIGAAIADYYPKFSLQALLGYESLSTANLTGNRAAENQGALGFRWRLFDFGRIDAEVAAARGRQAEALAAYRQAVLRAAEDVENALVVQTQREVQARDLHQAERALARARQATGDAYDAGAVSLLDVLDAERQLLLTQDQAVQADAERARAAVALQRAVGG